jgi:hypothetical protein
MKYKIVNKDNKKYVKTHIYNDDWTRKARRIEIVYGTFDESIFFHNLKDCKKYLELIKNKGNFKVVRVKEEKYEEWLSKFKKVRIDIKECMR